MRKRNRSTFHRVYLALPVRLDPQGEVRYIPQEPEWGYSGPWHRRRGIKHPLWATKPPIPHRKLKRRRRQLSR